MSELADADGEDDDGDASWTPGPSGVGLDRAASAEDRESSLDPEEIAAGVRELRLCDQLIHQPSGRRDARRRPNQVHIDALAMS